MMAVWLIAANFVREQRWFILMMAAYVAGITGLILAVGRDFETLLFVQQEGLYGIFFGVVLAVSFFQNARKTQRDLAVLSKAVTRGQYVAGAILGANLTTLAFYAVMFAGLFLLFPEAEVSGAAGMVLQLVVACALATVVTVLYATFLHPLLATMAAAVTLALPAALERVAGEEWAAVLPVYTLARNALRYKPEAPPEFEGGAVLLALGECVVLWAAAAWIFSRRDIATPVE